MNDNSPGKNAGKLVTYTVYSNGSKISDKYQFKNIEVCREVNRIGSQRRIFRKVRRTTSSPVGR